MILKQYLVISCIFFIVIFNSCDPLPGMHGTGGCYLKEVLKYEEAAFEVDTRFLQQDDGTIIFSANNTKHFLLFEYRNGKVKPFDTLKNVFNPFLFQGRVVGLHDNQGDEKFVSTDSIFNSFFSTDSFFSSVYSFRHGNLIFVKLQNDYSLYIIDVEKNKKRKIINMLQRLHAIDYSSKHNFAVINYDNKLISVDLNDYSITELAHNSNEEAMNPFIFEEKILFASNYESEYYQIYQASVTNKVKIEIDLLYKSPYDIRMPKIYGGYLYFVSIIKNEYLLNRKKLTSNSVKPITHKGVIYNYEFYNDDHLLLVYADFNTPRTLVLYDQLKGTFIQLIGKKLKLPIEYKYVPQQISRSSAYLLYPKDIEMTRGIILFFHPGLHANFSPRWDSMLFNLANNDYLIVVPNFPMSSGSGKTFYNAEFSDAVDDISKWKRIIRRQYSQIPLYYLSTSSGNILMEQALMSDSMAVSASASLFGISSLNYPNLPAPNLYIFGKNDPSIDFEIAAKKLSKQLSINVLSYENEGHWFRKSINLKQALVRIDAHFANYDTPID